jgi:hypothetical protein
MENIEVHHMQEESARAFNPVGLLLIPLFALTCSGCFALAAGAAGGAAGAVYVLGKLTDELDHDVPIVHRAAVAAMNDLGLKLSENRSDKLSAHMESEFSDGTNIWLDMQSIADARTKLTIRVGVTGDEVRARKIDDMIRSHLPRAAG